MAADRSNGQLRILVACVFAIARSTCRNTRAGPRAIRAAYLAHTRNRGRIEHAHAHQSQSSAKISHAARHVRRAAPRWSPSRTEKNSTARGGWKREPPMPEGLLELLPGICLIGNRHGRRATPAQTPSARPHRVPKMRATRARACPLFHPLTLILFSLFFSLFLSLGPDERGVPIGAAPLAICGLEIFTPCPMIYFSARIDTTFYSVFIETTDEF